ncbi:hypothetical protein SJ05684_b57050 (plasmid) [Sinorhizobium sojae CCBAU 05684]|uniref:Uncharacterized protein n=1 Tax=Sinorhizobium sojae CCBAU 05684 TaxID=716928 RepID=A0A249PLR5_9HYPH|nr:hypothetical protein SJ05684_b57050 [Sinorhizobium sojae CCBAU 05684]
MSGRGEGGMHSLELPARAHLQQLPKLPLVPTISGVRRG